MGQVDVPSSQAEKITTRRGFIDEGEVPLDLIADATEGGEVRIDLEPAADWIPDEDKHRTTAYVGPIEAVQLGERLVAAGRQALAEVLDAVPASKKAS